MLPRCLQAFAALAFLAFVAGAPSQAFAHAGETHAEPSRPIEIGERAVAPAAARSLSLSASWDRSKETRHHPGCVSCCACGGAGCQSAALPAQIGEAPLVRAAFNRPFDAAAPPRRARSSPEHPPKSFA